MQSKQCMHIYKNVHANTYKFTYIYTHIYIHITCSLHTYLSALWPTCFRLSPNITAAIGWPISEFLSVITHFMTWITDDDWLNGGEPQEFNLLPSFLLLLLLLNNSYYCQIYKYY